MHALNQSSLHPDIATIFSVSAAVQLSNPTSGGTREDGGLFAISIFVFLTPGGTIHGKPGGGAEFAMAVFLQFFEPRRSLFFRDERGEDGKNKVGPKPVHDWSMTGVLHWFQKRHA